MPEIALTIDVNKIAGRARFPSNPNEQIGSTIRRVSKVPQNFKVSTFLMLQRQSIVPLQIVT